jgi:copper chaperone CopZ
VSGGRLLLVCALALPLAVSAARAGASAPEGERPSAALERVELAVEGTHCAACLTKVRRELRALAGVERIESGERTAHLVVYLRVGAVERAELLRAVERAGYRARLVAPA